MFRQAAKTRKREKRGPGPLSCSRPCHTRQRPSSSAAAVGLVMLRHGEQACSSLEKTQKKDREKKGEAKELGQPQDKLVSQVGTGLIGPRPQDKLVSQGRTGLTWPSKGLMRPLKSLKGPLRAL